MRELGCDVSTKARTRCFNPVCAGIRADIIQIRRDTAVSIPSVRELGKTVYMSDTGTRFNPVCAGISKESLIQ